MWLIYSSNFPFVEVKMIAHCMKKVKWEKIKDQTYWGHESVENEGFAEVLKCLR
jgi:hypothetical protein